jgi:hypothetical protein
MKELLLKRTPELTAAVFLWAGIHKAFHPGEAIFALVSLDLPFSLSSWIVEFATALELYLSILLFRKIDLRYGLRAATGLILVYTVFLWYLSTLAHPPSCGCLGLTGLFNSTKQEAIFGLCRNCVMLWLLWNCYNYYFPSRRPVEKPVLTC